MNLTQLGRLLVEVQARRTTTVAALTMIAESQRNSTKLMIPEQPPIDNNFVAPGCELFQSVPPPDRGAAPTPDDQLKDLGWRYNRLKSDLARCEADFAKLRKLAAHVVKHRDHVAGDIAIDNLAAFLANSLLGQTQTHEKS